MQTININTSFLCIVMVVTSLSLGGSVLAKQSGTRQVPSETPNSNFGQAQTADAFQDKPKLKLFYDTTSKIKQNRVTINRLFGSIPVGFPKMQKEQEAEIKRLEAENYELQNGLIDVASEAYLEAPNEDRGVLSIMEAGVKTLLKPPAKGDFHFNPGKALEVSSILIKHDAPLPQLYMFAYQASIAIQDFERAQNMLVRAEENGAVIPDTMKEHIATLRASWNRELQIRRQESATDDLPQVKFETSTGDFTVELFENHAPQTVANFIYLVEKGFYDGLTFHRVIPAVISQGGCPKGNGTGNAGYNIPCECERDEIRQHFTGTLSMANNGVKDTASCQFFFTHQPNKNLDGRYTAFGRIIGNIENVVRLPALDLSKRVGPIPKEPGIIKKITVLRKRDHEYLPTKIEIKGVAEGSDTKNTEGSDTKNATGNESPNSTEGSETRNLVPDNTKPPVTEGSGSSLPGGGTP